MFKVYKRKIHIYVKRADAWDYVCSTNAAKTCKDAVARFKDVHGIPLGADTVRAWFAKN